MSDIVIPIAQLIRNYLTNLPAFPPADYGALHAAMIAFYRAFRRAAEARAIPEADQQKIVERAQKTLWAFARCGQVTEESGEPLLAISRSEAQANLKFPRAEETFAMLGDLGFPVLYQSAGVWSAEGKVKTSDALGLRFAGSPALTASLSALASEILAGTRKEKMAFERFLRVNPQAVLAGEKPPLNLPADAPSILANLPEGPRQAWQELVQSLVRYTGFEPVVEFRSIHHGMWAVNYSSHRGARDLCGLIVQNSVMTVRIILYGEKHFMVRDRLELFGEAVRGAFHNAHYYEEFEHQWLFIPCETHEDVVGIEKLLAFIQ